MKLLAILNAFPYPPTTGSRIVAAHTLRELAKNHDVTLLTKEWGSADLAAQWGIASYSTLTPREARPSVALRAFEYAAKRISAVAPLLDRDFKRLIDARVREAPPDAILLFEYWAVPLVPPELHSKTLVNIEDPPSLRQERLGKLANIQPFVHFRSRIEHRYYAKHEVAHLRSMARVFVLSGADLEDYRRSTGLDNLAHCPYGIARPPETPPLDARDPNTIAISGNMFHPPNEDGILDFLRRVFPKVLAMRPGARLRLVGASPTERIRKAASHFGDSIEVTGRVPDVSEYLGRCVVSACPVHLKIGVQTKILEAMRMGTPVVTWSSGNSGVGGTPGVHLEEATSDMEFATKVVGLLEGNRWNDFSRASVAFVENCFSWERSASKVIQECERVGMTRM